jgi:pyrroline-5-carboxylate reductase
MPQSPDSDATPFELAVLGFGAMGSAVLRGALAADLVRPESVLVVEPDAARRGQAAELGCRTGADPTDAAAARILLVAVKPQSFAELAPSLRRRARRTLVLSVMAGISGARIAEAVGAGHAVVRAMPNMPARIRCGVTALSTSVGAEEKDLAEAERLFAGVGETVRVPERLLDAVTATSGSGPAYLYLMAEAWETAARDLGLEADVARRLVRGTILGAARLLAEDGADPVSLRAAVTSKGGTTAAAIESLERSGLRAAMRDAIVAAALRAAELSSA